MTTKYEDCKNDPEKLVEALAALDGNNLEEMAEFFDIDLQKKGAGGKVDPAAIKKEVGDKCLEAAEKVDPRTNRSLKGNPDAQKAYDNVRTFDDGMQNLEKYAEMAKAEKTEKKLDALGDLFGNKPSKKSKKDPQNQDEAAQAYLDALLELIKRINQGLLKGLFGKEGLIKRIAGTKVDQDVADQDHVKSGTEKRHDEIEARTAKTKEPAAAGTTEPAATASEPALSAPANSSSVKPDITSSDVPSSKVDDKDDKGPVQGQGELPKNN